MLFPSGQFVMTRGVASYCEEHRSFFPFVTISVARHLAGDWGDLCKEDKKLNDKALKSGDRLLSAYEQDGQKIWIITEWDRSVTTVLFPDEY